MAAKPKSAEPSRLDRILQAVMATLGLVLILGSLAVIVNSALTAATPAEISVFEQGRDRLPSGVAVRIEARNDGDLTAASVEIEGRLEVAGQPEETASVTVDYLPGHSRQTAVLRFDGDTPGGVVTLAAKGWTTP